MWWYMAAPARIGPRRGFSLVPLSGRPPPPLGGAGPNRPAIIAARLAQGATAALMVPQVLATIHLLFADAARARAFGIYGIVLGLAGATGFLLGSLLVTLDLAGLGWREAGAIGAPPAVTNAICDALGIKDVPMPATPYTVWRAAR